MIAPLHAIAQLMALRFVDSLLEGTIVAVFAAMVLRSLRRQSAAARFAVCFSGLVAIALLPFLRGWSAVGVAGSTHAAFTLPESWALYMFTAWAMFAGWFLIGFARAIWHVQALRKSCIPIDEGELDPLLKETLRSHRTNRRVAFCSSDEVAVPTALGLLSPAIVLPDWVMAELSAADLNQILLHELAHLRRWDDWTNLAQQFVRAVFFFHPAVWWIERRVALEREMACDDAVLKATASPRAYAECLAHLAEKSVVRRSLALAQAALGRVRHMSVRVATILSPDRNTPGVGSWKTASLVAGFAVMCAVGVSKAPTLVAFQDVVPAKMTEQASSASPAISVQRPVRIDAKWTGSSAPAIPAKLKMKAPPRTGQRPAIVAVASAVKTKPAVANVVHQATAKMSSMPVTETVFFVIESGSRTDQPVYQIQMWRVTILHVKPEVKAPPKQI